MSRVHQKKTNGEKGLIKGSKNVPGDVAVLTQVRVQFAKSSWGFYVSPLRRHFMLSENWFRTKWFF